MEAGESIYGCECKCHQKKSDIIPSCDKRIKMYAKYPYPDYNDLSSIHNGYYANSSKLVCGDDAIMAAYDDGFIRLCMSERHSLGRINWCFECNHEGVEIIPGGFAYTFKIPGLLSASASEGCYLLADRKGYAWSFGINDYGQVGQSSASFNIPNPTRIPGIENVKEVYTGNYHSALILKNDNVLIFGRNENSELGLYNRENKIITPMLNHDLSYGSKIKKICFGLKHTIVLTEDGKIKGAGSNQYGQLGMAEKKDVLVFTDIPVTSRKIIDVATGGNHTVILTENGNVYAFGLNCEGRLGTGSWDREIINPPQKIIVPEKVKSIHTSNNLTLFECANGVLYRTGNGIAFLHDLEEGRVIDDLVGYSRSCLPELVKLRWDNHPYTSGFEVKFVTHSYVMLKH